jgi:hypothetical protein
VFVFCATPAATSTVIFVVEFVAGVTTNVYDELFVSVNVPFVPPATVTSAVANPVTASLNVNVYVTSPPAIFAVPASSSVIVTVGLTVSTA